MLASRFDVSFPFLSRWLPATCWLGVAPALLAQASGTFVIPASRPNGGTRFSYWDRFALPGGTTASYFYNHFPNLMDLGDDADPPNPSNWNTNAKIQQVLTAQCFVTSSGALYSFAAITGFEVTYTHAGTIPVTGAVFQISSAGSSPRMDSIRLRYQPTGGGAPVLLAPDYQALDDPGTAGFGERVMRGYEWNLTGLGVTNYVIRFASAGSSMALYQAQLDTSLGATFHQALGHLLSTHSTPGLRYGVGGKVNILSAEKRFFTAGQEVPLTATDASGFNAVGWIRPDGSVLDSPGEFMVTFATQNPADLAVSAIFSPSRWQSFREGYFEHLNSLTGTVDDYTNDAISGPAADPDGDGADNFTEYAFGGDPLMRDASRMAPVPVVLTESGISYPGLIYRRRAGENDLFYQVQVSSGLNSWQAGTEETLLVAETNGPLESDGTRTVTARALVPLSHPAVFLRVKALPATP